MSSPRASLAVFVGASIAWAAACLDSPPRDSDGGDAGSKSQSETGAGDDWRVDMRNDEGSGVNVEAAVLGLLVDDMSATMGTRIALPAPDGGSPGSYSTYSDFPNSNSLGMKSDIAGTAQLSDTPVSPPILNPDGSQIAGELCLGRNRTEPGMVVSYAGLNLNFAYGVSGAGVADAGSSALPFDSSRYSGVSFYIRIDPPEAGPAPSMRFGLPDTQTADPVAWPRTSCALQAALDSSDSSGRLPDSAPLANPCDDDFGADLGVAPGAWSKVELHWGDLAQQGWGAQFGALRTDELIGMKWQVNGSGADAATESFYFCISDIYFMP